MRADQTDFSIAPATDCAAAIAAVSAFDIAVLKDDGAIISAFQVNDTGMIDKQCAALGACAFTATVIK